MWQLVLLLPVFEALQRVGEDVPGELALMLERRAAVHARIHTRRAGCLPAIQILQPNNSDINFLCILFLPLFLTNCFLFFFAKFATFVASRYYPVTLQEVDAHLFGWRKRMSAVVLRPSDFYNVSFLHVTRQTRSAVILSKVRSKNKHPKPKYDCQLLDSAHIFNITADANINLRFHSDRLPIPNQPAMFTEK